MKKACVIGWPISHSRSPLIHGYWLKIYGIEGDYERQAVEPAHFAAFVRSMPSLGFIGGNVTVPHKEAAFRLADVWDATAEAIGAANTLWFEGGKLHVANTDIYGFLANLDEEIPGWDAKPGPAVVLGAGGASRAVIRGLLDRGFGEIRILNRTLDRAWQLASDFGGGVRAVDWKLRAEALGECKFLVNTTALGMAGFPALELDLGQLPAEAAVADIIYDPLETPLLQMARKRGHRVSGGLGMLLHQAVPGFERWFGVRPVVTAELRALIANDVNRAKPPC